MDTEKNRLNLCTVYAISSPREKFVTWYASAAFCFFVFRMGGSTWGQGVRTPLKNLKKYIGFHSNTGRSGFPEIAQGYKSSIQCWAIIGTPAKRHLNGVSLAGRWWPSFSSIYMLSPFIKKKKKKKKKKIVRVGHPLAKRSGSAHGQHCLTELNITF